MTRFSGVFSGVRGEILVGGDPWGRDEIDFEILRSAFVIESPRSLAISLCP